MPIHVDVGALGCGLILVAVGGGVLGLEVDDNADLVLPAGSVALDRGAVGAQHVVRGDLFGVSILRRMQLDYVIAQVSSEVRNHGLLVCPGRDDDMLRVGAQWVSPLEVESVLLSHPGVAECAVVGRADADGLVKVCAYVVLRSDAPPPDLDNICAERLARHKRPRWIEPVDELPKTATGKVQRFRLRETARA